MRSPSFIGQYYFNTQEIGLCDDLITAFNSCTSEDKSPGRISNGVDKRRKDSIDIGLDSLDPVLGQRYVSALSNCINQYTQDYPWSINACGQWGFVEPPQLQYYEPLGGFRQLHCENDGTRRQRHLVYMTYLNTVNDQGGTHFHHQDITVQPRKGLTLIWPVAWTHMHRGVVSPTESKYIVTGWLDFVDN